MMKTSAQNNFIKFLMVFVFSFSTGCSNIFKATADKTSDAAKLEDVRQLMNDKNWDEAIEKLESLSAAEKLRVSTIETWASAYAGRCGLDFLSYLDSLGNADLDQDDDGTDDVTMFQFFMRTFQGVAVSYDDCQLAQEKIEEISTDPTERTSGQNLFMAILGMVKIGTFLRGIADVNGTDNLGNGSADTPADGGTYDSCNTSKLTKVQAQKIMTGIGLITSNLTALTDVLTSGAITDALGDISTLCGGSCGTTDYTLVGDPEVLLIRNMLATGPSQPTSALRIGIDNTCNTDITMVPCCLTP